MSPGIRVCSVSELLQDASSATKSFDFVPHKRWSVEVSRRLVMIMSTRDPPVSAKCVELPATAVNLDALLTQGPLTKRAVHQNQNLGCLHVLSKRFRSCPKDREGTKEERKGGREWEIESLEQRPQAIS